MKRATFLKSMLFALAATALPELELPEVEPGAPLHDHEVRAWPRWMHDTADGPFTTGNLDEWDGNWLDPGDQFLGGTIVEVDYVARTITVDRT